MRAIKIFTFIALCVTLFSFSGKPKSEKKLIGTWVFDRYDHGTAIYIRSESFTENKGGFYFQKNGQLMIRQNIGWCGTPPISYGNYNGTWKLSKTNLLSLRHGYWGGETKSSKQIEFRGNDTLRVRSLR